MQIARPLDNFKDLCNHKGLYIFLVVIFLIVNIQCFVSFFL